MLPRLIQWFLSRRALNPCAAAAIAVAVIGWVAGQTPPGPAAAKRPRAETQKGKQTAMPDQFTTAWDPEPVKIDVIGRPITPTPRPTLARAQPASDGAARRCFVNDSLNSRAALTLGDSAWRVRWRETFQPNVMPICLMTNGDRIVVQSLSEWNLWDTAGKLVAAGPLTASSMVLDPATGVFLAGDHAGLIVARRLEDGQAEFRTELTQGPEFARTFMARRGQKLFALSIEMQTDPHLPPPEKSMLEIVDLGSPSPQRSFGQPGAPVVSAELTRASSRMIATMGGDSITVTTDDRLYRFDLDLRFQSVVTGFFSPRFISLDEAGRIYLLADARGGPVLWQMSEHGERYYDLRLPPATVPSMPSAVGYDHTAYVVAGNTIYSVAPDGKLNWSRTAIGTVAGVAVTPDDMLLVSEGSDLATYNRLGERRTLQSFTGEHLTTGPVFTERGDLLVASGSALYSLERVKP